MAGFEYENELLAECVRAWIPVISRVNPGMPLGTVLSLTMAVTALSLPKMVILGKVLQHQWLMVFIALATLGIIRVGYLFQAIL